MILIIKTIGEHWTVSFSWLQKSINSINSRILTERLDEWVANWYIIRDVSTSKPLKISYKLTEKWNKLALKITDLCDFAINEID